MFIVKDKAGIDIESVDELENAKFIIKMFEEADKRDNIYIPNFYEIYNTVTEEIVE